MKKILPILLVVVAFASCGTTKHTMKRTQCVSADSMVQQAKADVKLERQIDTTRFENGTITITEIDFFDVPLPDFTDTTTQGDAVKIVGASATLPKVGSFKGIKKLKQTTIENKTVQKGETQEREDWQSSMFKATNRREEAANEVEQTPTPDPYRWRYIFYLSVVALIVLLILKRSKVASTFWRLVGYLKRKF